MKRKSLKNIVKVTQQQQHIVATGIGGLKGEPGEPGPEGPAGQPGPAGQDGYSPSATVTQSGSDTTITITDKDGTTSATVTTPTKTSQLTNDSGFVDATYVAGEIGTEATARENADSALSGDISDINTAINKTVITDLVVDPNASTSVLQLDATKTNIKTSTTTTDNIPLPVASSTQAGVMNSATYDAVTTNTNNINALMDGAVAISNISANPTQADLTSAWQTATGLTTLINRAVIYDVTNSKLWTYYTNTSYWYSAAAGGGSVTVNQFTNSSLGTIKGSTTDGQVFAENDGTGSVNGWDTLTSTVADHTSAIANIPTKTSQLTNDSDFVSGSGTVGGLILPVYSSNGTLTPCKVFQAGNNWNNIVRVSTDGVMEIGKYIDFHATSNGASDNDGRLEAMGNNVLQIAGTNADLVAKRGTTEYSLQEVSANAPRIGSTVGTPTSIAYVATANIQDDAVTTDKIDDGAVTAAKIDFTTQSTTEQVVGKTVDGRTIYECSYTGSHTHTANTRETVLQILNQTGVLLGATGYVSLPITSTRTFKIPVDSTYYDSTGNKSAANWAYATDDNRFLVSSYSGFAGTGDYYITLRYTKS